MVISSNIAAFGPFGWLKEQDAGVIDDLSLTSFPSLVALVMSGDCVTLMPNAIAYVEPSLVCGFVTPDEFALDFWAVYPARVKGHPHLRKVIEAAIRATETLRRLPPADGSEG